MKQILFLFLLIISFKAVSQISAKRVKSQTDIIKIYSGDESRPYVTKLTSIHFNKNGDTVKIFTKNHYSFNSDLNQKTRFRKNGKKIKTKKKGNNIVKEWFNEKGKITRQKFSRKEMTSYHYDAFGNLIMKNTRAKKILLFKKLGYYYLYDFDSNRNMIKSSYFYNVEEDPQVINYEYNEKGLMSKIIYGKNFIICSYDHKDNLISKASYNSWTRDTTEFEHWDYSYTDSSYTVFDKAKNESQTFLNSGQRIQHCVYKYDSVCSNFRYNNLGDCIEWKTSKQDTSYTNMKEEFNDQGYIINKKFDQLYTTHTYNNLNLLVMEEVYKLDIPYSYSIYEYNEQNQVIKKNYNHCALSNGNAVHKYEYKNTYYRID